MCRDWEFVSKGTEISLGKFVSEYFTPLTLDSWSDVVSTDDTDEIWKEAKEEAMEKVKGKENSQVRAKEDHSPGVSKDFRLWGVLLQGHVGGDREAAYPYHDRS